MNGFPRRKVVLALIERDGKFVLIRRKIEERGVRWAFPGGVTEEGETEEEAVVREAEEEVGMRVVVCQKLLERKHPNTFVPVVYFYCKPTDSLNEPQVLEPYEIDEVAWVPAEEVLGRFTSDVDERIREFVLSHSRKKELVG